MSLREEIQNYIRYKLYSDADDTEIWVTNDILSIFEKRIDIMIEESTHAVQHDTLKYQVKEMLSK